MGVSLAALLAAYSIAPAARGASGEPRVHGEVIRDFARISFEWPRTTYLDASAEENTLTVTFDRTAEPDLEAVMLQLSPYVTGAQVLPDKKTVRFTLNKHYRIRSFVSGNISGVDLVGIDPAVRTAKKDAPVPASARQVAEATRPQEPKPAVKTAALIREKQAKTAAQLAKLAPAADAPHPEEKPAEAPAAHVEAAPPAAPAEAPKPTPADTGIAPPVVAAVGEPLRFFAAVKENRTVLRFPWPERTAAAVFRRGEYVWIVFNRPGGVDPSAVELTTPEVLQGMRNFTTADATVVRLRSSATTGAIVEKGKEPFEWQVTLTSPAPPPVESLEVAVRTEPPLPAHVFLPALEMGETLSLTDPEIGDELIVIPFYKPGQGVAQKRRFVEFTLLDSAEGIAVQKIADDVGVQRTLGGLRIGSKAGSLLSSGLPDLPKTPARESEPSDTMFPYAEWKGEGNTLFVEREQALKWLIVQASDEESALKQRLALAQLYLAEGLGAEALGELGEIRRLSPGFYSTHRLSGMVGAANFLISRYGDAAEAFSSQDLGATAEMEFWRSMLADLLGTPGQRFDYLANDGMYISKYPPAFRQRIAIIAADRAIAAQEYDTAVKILDQLEQEKLLAPVADYGHFLLAKIDLESGREAEGEEQWKTLASNYANPFVRARAEFSLINHERTKETITEDQVIDRLERLRLGWRGDALEMSVLSQLSDIYDEKKDYVKLLRISRDLFLAFPNTEMAQTAQTRMREAFQKIFAENVPVGLSPFEQLALYYEFRDLTPSDDSSDTVIHGLAERLISLDLMEQAEQMMDQRMRFLYEKEQRSRTGALLARIYLDDSKPQAALDALQNSVYGDNAEEMRVLRDRLAAQAMIDLGQFESAFSLLAEDKSGEATAIRARAWWKQKNWGKLAEALEESLKNRKDPAAPLLPAEREILIRLAVAYRMLEENEQLQYLRDYFTPQMQGTAREKLFATLTQPNAPLTPENLEATFAQLEETRGFLKEYRTEEMVAALAAEQAAPAP